MNKFTSFAKPLWWILSLLTMALVAGCGDSGSGSSSVDTSNYKAITAYSLAGVTGTINETTKTISVAVPYGTNVTALVATFTSTGESVKISGVEQVSGSTANNFTGPMSYVVTAPNKTTAIYTVTVMVASSQAKAITAYKLAGVPGTINETARTIAVTVPFGTDVTKLSAVFTTTGASVNVVSVIQNSGSTVNDFTNPVIYTVVAADNTTATYTVTVTVAVSFAKSITAYSLAGVTGAINETTKDITVTMPSGTNVTALVATFTSTGTGAVTVLGVAQVSGTTQNDFSNALLYTVTAADHSTATYTVTVIVAKSAAKAITAYSLNGVTGIINDAAKTIVVSMPSGTIVTGLVATFTTTGTSVKVNNVEQVSGTTANSFTNSVAYLVTAADTTTSTYNVSVTFVSGPVVCTAGTSCVDLGTAANYVILDEATVTFTPIATNITSPTITGDVAVSPAAASLMTGFSLSLDSAKCFSTSTQVTGKLYAADYSSVNGCATATTDTATILTTAVGDKINAYNLAAGKAAGVGASNLNLLAGVIPNGQNFAPGTYTWDSGTPSGNVGMTGNITLTGTSTDVWIFQISGNLTLASATNITLVGALPQNVFWQVAGGVTVGTGAHMEGVVLSATNISLVSNATVKGRLFGRTGVLMDSNTVTKP